MIWLILLICLHEIGLIAFILYLAFRISQLQNIIRAIIFVPYSELFYLR